jgi:hypothetical protein
MSIFGKWIDKNSARLDTIKNIAEIFAFVSAGFWAIFNFQIKESPSLERSIMPNADLTIDSLNKDYCLLVYNLDIKNHGKTSFDIDSVQFRYWLIPLDTIVRYKRFNEAYYMENYPCEDSLMNYFLAIHYVPDNGTSQTQDFITPVDSTKAVICEYQIYYTEKHWFSKNKKDTIAGYDVELQCKPKSKSKSD